MSKTLFERLHAFEDPNGEVYLGYNAQEIAEELNAPFVSSGRKREPGSPGYVALDDITMLDDDVILENDRGESVDVATEIAKHEAGVHALPRSDARNRGIVACIWTYYCEANGY